MLNLADLSSKYLISRGGAGSIQLHRLGGRRVNLASSDRGAPDKFSFIRQGGAGFDGNLCKFSFMEPRGRRIKLYGTAAMSDVSQSERIFVEGAMKLSNTVSQFSG